MADILGWISGFKELVSVIETRLIADVTAANTRFQNLINAINGLELSVGTTVVEAPNVNVYPKIIVNCGCGGSGQPPQTGGEEGGTPPEGSTYPSEIDSRKCKAATIIVDDIIAYTNGLDGMGLFNWSLDFTSLSTAARSIIGGSTLLLGNIWSNVTGLFEQLAIAIWDSELSPGAGQAIQAKRADLICALYNAQNVTEARDNALTASGLTGGPAAWLNRLLVNDVLNILFFASGDSESVIGSYAGAVDCVQCNPQQYAFQLGNSGQYSDHLIGDWRTVNCTNEDGFKLIAFTAVGGNIKIEFRNLTGWTGGGWGNSFAIGRVTGGDIHHSNLFSSFAAASATQCLGDVSPDFSQWAIVSSTPCSVEIKVSSCTP